MSFHTDGHGDRREKHAGWYVARPAGSSVHGAAPPPGEDPYYGHIIILCPECGSDAEPFGMELQAISWLRWGAFFECTSCEFPFVLTIEKSRQGRGTVEVVSLEDWHQDRLMITRG